MNALPKFCGVSYFVSVSSALSYSTCICTFFYRLTGLSRWFQLTKSRQFPLPLCFFMPVCRRSQFCMI